MNQKKTFWDNVAWGYDCFELAYSGEFRALYRLLNDIILPGSKVLEAAAGTGKITAAIAARAGSVLCTDLSEPMLEQARRRMAKKGHTNVTCQHEDLLHLSADYGTFDAAIAANVLHLLPDPGAAVKELLRVVRPGGRVILPVFLVVEARGMGRLGLRLMSRFGYASASAWNTGTYRRFLDEQGLNLVQYEVLPGPMPMAVAVAELPGGTQTDSPASSGKLHKSAANSL